MAILALLRRQVMSKVFGEGASGVVAASALAWLVEQLRESGEKSHILDTSRLVPGETYTVRTRPPMDSAERRLAARYEKASKALAAASRPSGRQLRAASALAKAQRRADRRPDDASAARKAEVLGMRFDRLTVVSSRHQALIDEVDRLDRELEVRREAAIRSIGRRRRPPQTRRFF